MTTESCELILAQSGDPSPPRQTAEEWAGDLEREVGKHRMEPDVKLHLAEFRGTTDRRDGVPRARSRLAHSAGTVVKLALCVTVLIALALPGLLLLAVAAMALGWLFG